MFKYFFIFIFLISFANSHAEKKDKILESVSSPAEFTWTWDRYKKLFIEDKRISNGRNC